MSITLANVRRTKHPYAAEANPGAFLGEDLEEVRSLVAVEAPDAAPLLAALDETLEHEAFISRDDHGRKLIAAIGPTRNSKIEGLTYIEGSEFDGRTFMAATISTWVSRSNRLISGARHLHNSSMTEQRRGSIRRRFYESGLGNWDNLFKENGVSLSSTFWGLPVRSATIVTPVGNQAGDIQVPFRHGNWQDVLAVSGLQVSDGLKSLVMDAVLGEHAAKRLAEKTVEQKLQTSV